MSVNTMATVSDEAGNACSHDDKYFEAMNSYDCAERETCGSLSTGEAATTLDIDALGDESDQERIGGATWNRRFTEEDVAEPVDVAAWSKVSERLAETFIRCSAEETERIDPQSWRTVGARIFQSLADLSDEE